MTENACSRRLTALTVAGAAVLLATAAASASLQPSQLLSAYGFGTAQQSYTGAGQTIAIYSSAKYSTMQSDMDYFSTKYMAGKSTTIKVVDTSGNDLTGTTGTASAETALDMEYAHLIAPDAKIVVVYGQNISLATQYAAQTLKASVVSISYGGYESSQSQSSFTTSEARYKAAVAAGATVLSAAGDSGHFDYPSSSAYSVSVGATQLTVAASGRRSTEVGWATDSAGTSGGGGGQSTLTREPTWQYAVQSSNFRQGPDVSIAGGSQSAMPVFTDATSSSDFSYHYGASIATPIWAGLIALVDQARVSKGLTPLNTTDLMTLLYNTAGTSTYSNIFYDITSGTNAYQGVTAGTGFDMVTGLGSPNVPALVNFLSTATLPEPMSLSLLGIGVVMLRRRRC